MEPGDEGRVGLRERKKREARDAMSWAVVRLSVEHGWKNVSIEDIAAAANVSVRTFRNYFAGKAEALVSRHLDRMVLIADELRARPAAEPIWDAITAAALTQFTLGRPDEDVPAPSRAWADGIRLMLTEPEVQGELGRATLIAQRDLTAAIAERTATDPSRDMYPHLVAAVAGAALTTAMDQWLRAEPPVSIGTLVRDAFAQVALGLPVL